MKDHAPAWRRIAFYIEQKRYHHLRSNRSPNYPDFIMVDYSTALNHRSPQRVLQVLHKQPHSLDLQPNHYLHLLPFARLLPPYSQQSTRTNQMLREPDHSCVIFSMKSDSHPNSIVKSTTQHLLTNISIASATALALEDFLCMYRFGIIGPAGANAAHTPQLKHLFRWSWIPLHASDHFKRKKDSKPSRTRMMTHIKALRWVALKLDLPVLTALQSQTVSDFLKSHMRIPFERSEAAPIPLAALAAWEQRILSDDSSLPEIITLGCFLIATVVSLRFRDLLRTKPATLSIQGHILRGISWRTKTSVSGQPWGVCCLGVTIRPSVRHWVFRFLEAISSPCSYHHALALIRLYIQCSWLTPPLLTLEQAKHPSTHSMKSTLLAAAGQLNLNLEQRAKQGHRKKSVQLYSRDDVWPSLFLQRDILVDISTGWRPLTSQSRGAKQPLPEPPFLAPPITPADLQLLQMVTPKLAPQTLGHTPDVTKEQQAPLSHSDSEDTSSSSSSSSSSEDEDIRSSSSSILVINDKSHVIHAARATSPDSSKRSRFDTRNTTFEVNCGSSVLGAPIRLVPEIPVGSRVCQRKACLAAIDHFLK